jgi:hypothetical protein
MTLTEANKRLSNIIDDVEIGNLTRDSGLIVLATLRNEAVAAGLELSLNDSLIEEAHRFYQENYIDSYDSSYDSSYC